MIFAIGMLFLVSLVVGCTKAKAAKSEKDNKNWAVRESTDSLLPGINPLAVSGDIVIAGSSTVYPLTERVAERFKNEGYTYSITIDSIGSGAGFERFCVAGEIDIANASRPIKQSEVDSARAIGRDPLEFRVGTDALAVVVSKENTFVKELTLSELALVFGGAKLWSDVNPAWPDKEIIRFIPGTDSGTFDYFVEVVMQKNKQPLLEATNVQLSEDDNILVQGIEGSPYSIGFFGYAYYSENADKLNVLSIDGIAPTAESVDKGTYPLARPLFIYSSANIMKEKPQVAAFLAFYLLYVNEEIKAAGYFPATEQTLEEAKNLWLIAAQGLY
jgi:phosphate transport system substrate-binding protein